VIGHRVHRLTAVYLTTALATKIVKTVGVRLVEVFNCNWYSDYS